MKDLFERIKKEAIKSMEFDLEGHKSRIDGLKHRTESLENEIKRIPTSIEEYKSEIALLEGQIEIMLRSIAEIEGFKLMEEE